MAPPVANRNLAIEKSTDIDRWSNVDALDPAWDRRAEIAARFIPAGSRVLDLGCGRMALRLSLPYGCSYVPCDLVARDAETVVCDFNAGQFPAGHAADADIIVMLGVLEYVADVDAFLEKLKRSGCDILLSYCIQEASERLDRPSLGWMNNFSMVDLAVLFDRFGFRIERSEQIDDLQLLMKLKPAGQEKSLAACSVAVVSYSDVGNFGDRLGVHIINSLLPPQADVHHLTFRTLAQARESYDLVVLGIGNSIFQPMLIDPVFDIVKRGKAAVGIFGTQYRGLMSRPLFDGLLDRLDIWFARYEDDVLLYGRGRKNVTHLGDWLITQFPMVRPTDDKPLVIGNEIWNELPLDRTIRHIQSFKNVFSPRLHPLLCALTSAELVAYMEQRESSAADVVSGKFASMLIDIFGRTYPEKKFFVVDRNAVIRYKARVDENVAHAGERIRAILRNVAVAAD
jgi:hypothetical protein